MFWGEPMIVVIVILATFVLLSGLDAGAWPDPCAGKESERSMVSLLDRRGWRKRSRASSVRGTQAYRSVGADPATSGAARWWWE